MLKKIREIEARRGRILKGGPPKDIERQHQSGKLTARERLALLFDKGSFEEIDLWIRPIQTGFDIDEKELPGDAVITGIGKIDGRPFCVYAHDFTVAGGTFGIALHHKVTKIMEMALEKRIPCIQIIDSGGERLQDWFGRPAHRPMLGGRGIGNTLSMYQAPGIMSGVVPQITLMLGPMYAGSAYVPTMSDFMIMRKTTAFMSVASPRLLKAVTFQDVTQEEIGGAELHARVTGSADFLVESDEEAIKICRELAAYIPLNNSECSPVVDAQAIAVKNNEQMLKEVSSNISESYDMHKIIYSIVDNGKFLELQALFARSLIIGFARLNGHAVGIVANNPAEDNGILTINTCDKQARFIRWCDAFNIPLIFLVDTPGFPNDRKQEQSPDGLVRTVPKPVFAICEATVPMVTVYIGRCFGVANLVMGTSRMGVDVSYCWPTAQVARMDPELAVEVIYGEEICSSDEPDKVRKERISQLLESFVSYPYHAVEQAMANDIIKPSQTREVLIKALKSLARKQPWGRPWRKHSLIPQ